MGKLKSIIANQKISVRNVIFKYTVTIAIVLLVCFIRVSLNITDTDYRYGSFISKLFVFLTCLGIGTFFVESVLKYGGKNNTLFWLGHVLNVIIAFIITWLNFSIRDIAGEKGETLFLKILWLYIILSIGISMYKIIRSSGLDFHKYSVSLVFGMIKVFSVFLVLNIGFIFLIMIFDTLIVDIDTWETIENVEILLTGAVYFPYALICIADSKEQNSKFVRNFLLYALMPIVLAAFVIVYIYIIKIIIVGELPSNKVFDICLNVFIIGAIIWTMAYAVATDKKQDAEDDGQKENLYFKIIKYMKYIYVPMVLLEIYSIGLRLDQYGFTTKRYLGLIAIVFQVIYIAWEPILNLLRRIVKRQKVSYGKCYEGLIFVVILLYFVSTLVPVINCDYVSYTSQKSRFEKALAKDDIGAAKGAYRYLEYSIYGEEYLDTNYTSAELSSLEDKFSTYEDNQINEWLSIDYEYEGIQIDISGYSHLYEINSHNYENEQYSIEYYEHYELCDDEGNRLLEVDLTELIYYAIERAATDSYEIEYEPYIVEASDGSRFIVVDASFRYNIDSGKIKYLDIEGYLLRKGE